MLPDDLQYPESRSPITYSKVLLVEGRDAFGFFKALLKHLNLLTQIEIRNTGGVDQLADYLGTLVITPGYSSVASLGIVRDAEDQDVDSVFSSVCSTLSKHNLSLPEQPMAIAEGKPRVSVFILPDCTNRGMLETLCLQTVVDDPAWMCIEQYFQCLQEQDVHLPDNRMPKAQLQAFLASRPEYVPHLGLAAHKGYWPWNNSAFERLEEFLRNL